MPLRHLNFDLAILLRSSDHDDDSGSSERTQGISETLQCSCIELVAPGELRTESGDSFTLINRRSPVQLLRIDFGTRQHAQSYEVIRNDKQSAAG